jgi:mRNA interferase MazF
MTGEHIMAFQRGDVVLIPFPFTNLAATKTRPAVVVGSATYHNARPDLLLAYVSSQVAKAVAPIDYLLSDWQAAGLLKPSFVRPKVAAIESSLVVHQAGRLSAHDLAEVGRRLRIAMDLTASALSDVASEVDFTQQPPDVVQVIAEISVAALAAFAKAGNSPVDLDRIRERL